MGFAVAPSALYWLVPVGLWMRFCLFGEPQRQSQWPMLHHWFRRLYVIPVLANFVFLAEVAAPRGEWGFGLWGFAVYYVGIHLLTHGYSGLAREGTNPASQEGRP